MPVGAFSDTANRHLGEENVLILLINTGKYNITSLEKNLDPNPPVRIGS